MAELLTEEEQLEALKRWWKENGKTTIAAVVVLGAGFFGWNQYQDHVQSQAEQGSALYEEFISATTELADVGAGAEPATEAEIATVTAIAAKLEEQYPKSLYANFAQLYLAKMAVNDGDLDAAKAELNKVITGPNADTLKELAQLRLARVEFAAGNYDAALSATQAEVGDAYASAYAELRGDIYLAQKDFASAQTAYQSSLDAISDPRSMRRSLIQLKLDNATIATDVAAAPAESEAAPASISEAAGDA